MVAREHLLTSLQMANFVADGFLRFDELVPAHLNAAAVAEMESDVIEPMKRGPGATLDKAWPRNDGIRAVFSLPEIQGVIHSLVGSAPHYDHHAVHIVPPKRSIAQVWHADNILDLRLDFDLQFFYFPHDTPREMGGTMILPGSHYRRISESDIARYHNFLNQYPIVCKAGTVFVVHHGIWHCAQANLTRQTRYMFKLRLNPTVPQQLLWNTDDLDDPEISRVLLRDHDWYGNEDRLENVNRIKFWRFLTRDDTFDVGYYLSRLENQPATGATSTFASAG